MCRFAESFVNEADKTGFITLVSIDEMDYELYKSTDDEKAIVRNIS